MIVVIADDITGAAELGGIGLRYNLHVVISDDIHFTSQPDLLIIYTNTRSMQKAEAVKVMEELTAKAKGLKPSLFYKKTDSVLRGHVLAEMKAQMKVLNVEKGLLVPVNPSLGRTIRDGHYYLNEQLVHQTSFSIDPEFPILSARIDEMLGKDDGMVNIISQNEKITRGVSVGEAQSNEDVAAWAKHSREAMLFAGGASFFDALLQTMYAPKTVNHDVQLASPLLLVSGTTYQKSIEKRKPYQHLFSAMPLSIFSNTVLQESDFVKWRDEIIEILSKQNKAIIAIGEYANEKADPNLLREKMSAVVQMVSAKIKIHELLIEGGSTAYSIIQKLGWQSFKPTEELQQGIVRMKVDGVEDVHFTIKPGSYEWPPQWNFNQ